MEAEVSIERLLSRQGRNGLCEDIQSCGCRTERERRDCTQKIFINLSKKLNSYTSICLVFIGKTREEKKQLGVTARKLAVTTTSFLVVARS